MGLGKEKIRRVTKFRNEKDTWTKKTLNVERERKGGEWELIENLGKKVKN